MDGVATTPDYYEPSLDAKGNYVDSSICLWPDAGLKCACGSRKDFVYGSKTKWNAHTKAHKHKAWLGGLTNNKANHYIQLQKKEDIIRSQITLLTQRENKLSQQELIIESLTNQIARYKLCPTSDLLS